MGFHQNPRNLVAIKKLPTSKQQLSHVRGFIDEIKLTSALKHPNIIRFVGVAWSTPERLAMVMEYLPMGDLQAFLKRNNQTLTWIKAKYSIALGAASAISYLHARRPASLIHRDIKAKNIVLTEQLQPKLIDFSVSRECCGDMTMTAGVGTPYWAASEVLEGERYTEQADIYSFGICLSDTGDIPFKDICSSNGSRLSPFQIINLATTKGLKPDITTDCPTMISEIVMECLRSNPTQRPTAAGIVARLTKILSLSSVSQITTTYQVPSSIFSNQHKTSIDPNFETINSMNDPILVHDRMPLEELHFTRLIGRGSFGEIWLGFHQSQQNSVAITKLLSLDQKLNHVQDFIDEIKLTASLDHPNIVQFIGVTWSTPTNLTMAMEYFAMATIR